MYSRRILSIIFLKENGNNAKHRVKLHLHWHSLDIETHVSFMYFSFYFC
jgi:hypothetical protein